MEGYRDFKNEMVIPYLLGVYDGEKFYCFDGDFCIEDFFRCFVTKKYRGCIFYAHFGAIFDFILLLDYLNKTDFKILPISQGSKIIKITISDKNNHRWYFCDTSALLPFGLDKLTKTFNVKYKKLEIIKKTDNYDSDLYNYYIKFPDLVIEYLKHDCIGLFEVLLKFKDEILKSGGDMGLTIASTSLKTYNHSYQSRSLFMCKRKYNDDMRQAYFGGRTEIFRFYAPEIKDSYYYYYDVNSLYPFVMRNFRFPVSQPNIIEKPKLCDVVSNDGITEAFINAPKDVYIPVLPSKIKVKYDKKLMFTIGNFHGYWDNALLKNAYDLNYKILPVKSYFFETDYIFKKYVDYF